MTFAEIALYFAALTSAYFGGYQIGVVVSYIKKLGNSA